MRLEQKGFCLRRIDCDALKKVLYSIACFLNKNFIYLYSSHDMR